jgi:pyridoxine 5-phosphate synthase
MLGLGVNIDHVATIRQARYRGASVPGEPDPIEAGREAELAGADCITVHLREDRRHIQDRDLMALSRTVRVKLNLEMAATDEMVRIAATLTPRRPEMVTLVPEGRAEVTTEGGLDVRGQLARLRGVVTALKGAGILTSAFIDPNEWQVRAALDVGFEACELHTGRYAGAFAACEGRQDDEALAAELGAIERTGELARTLGLRLHAGHALDYRNVGAIAAIRGMRELHIGHSIVSRAVFVGFHEAVREMKALMAGGR